MYIVRTYNTRACKCFVEDRIFQPNRVSSRKTARRVFVPLGKASVKIRHRYVVVIRQRFPENSYNAYNVIFSYVNHLGWILCELVDTYAYIFRIFWNIRYFILIFFKRKLIELYMKYLYDIILCYIIKWLFRDISYSASNFFH